MSIIPTFEKPADSCFISNPLYFFSNSKETANKKLVTSIHKLEGDVQSLRPGSETIPLRCPADVEVPIFSALWGRYEFVALQRERSEVTEQICPQ